MIRVKDFKRVVVKIGSALLVNQSQKKIRDAWLKSLVAELAELQQMGKEVLVVSSGSIALGRAILPFNSDRLKLEESQAAASVGQIALSRAWSEAFGQHGVTAGQILLTMEDTEARRRYLNARSTIRKLLQFNVVPIINENDTITTEEIRYGDNDRLAARVASMVSADCLVILSDVDGLYDRPPGLNEHASLIKEVKKISPQILAMAGGPQSATSRGGMTTKLEAAKIAVNAGCHMLICSGKHHSPLSHMLKTDLGTWFLPQAEPALARKQWIAGSLKVNGQLIVDDGALKALHSGRSLLPAGIQFVKGEFNRGDAVEILSSDFRVVAKGISAYDSRVLSQIIGKKSAEAEKVLGYKGRAETVHRDDFILLN